MNAKSNLRPFQPGQSGNPKGRAPGSRNKLGEAFIEALYADFREYGVETIAKVREHKPDQYLKVVASLVPKEMTVQTNPYEGITDDELEGLMLLLAELRQRQENESNPGNIDLDQLTH